MPYVADPDEATVNDVGRRLLAVLLRFPEETDGIRIQRSTLHQIAHPELRKEDFNESIRRLAEQSYSIAEATGTGKRADVVLLPTDEDVDGWEFLFYDDFPDDFTLEDVARLLTDVHGLDVVTPLSEDLLIKRKQREPIKHDPDVPRVCARCKETKETTEFARRSSNPDDRDYHRFQSYCTSCTRQAVRDGGYADTRTQRPERWKEHDGSSTHRSNGRPGGRKPNAVPWHGYLQQFTP